MASITKNWVLETSNNCSNKFGVVYSTANFETTCIYKKTRDSISENVGFAYPVLLLQNCHFILNNAWNKLSLNPTFI